MEKIKGDEPAFASKASSSNGTTFGSKGLTIRQHFAAMAMQGMLASINWNETVMTEGFINQTTEYSAKLSNSLIAELNKP